MTLRRLLCAVVSAALVVAVAVPAAATDPVLPEPGHGEPPQLERDLAADEARVLVRAVADGGALERALDAFDVEVVDEVEGLGYLVVEVTGGELDAREVAEELEEAGAIAEAVVDHRRHLFVPTRTPNDPYFHEQADAMSNVGAGHAWTITTGSPDVTVAVVDTGVDRNHPDLKGRVLSGRDFVAGGTNPSDPNGHGTAVAGVIAAKGDDRIGIAGMAWQSRILPVRVLDERGWGWDSDVAAGIVWAADQGARVINVSLGGPDPSPVLEAAVAHATSRGALVVAAAGNEGSDEPMYPAAISGVVAVGAVNPFGGLTGFSSFGPWIDMTGPGVDVLTTIPRSQGSYAYVSGTSIAAPFVSGTAALMLARWPSRTPSQLRGSLRSTARESGPPGIDAFVGWGMVDAGAAVGGSLADPLRPPTYDKNEPNDVPARATVLTANTPMSARMSPEGDVDWYRLDLPEPTTATLIVTPPGESPRHLASSIEPYVAVFDAQLRLVADDVDGIAYHPTQLTVNLPAGAMYVMVANLNGSTMEPPYAIRINTVRAPFRPAGALDPVATQGDALRLADLDGDGVDDLLVTSRLAPVGVRILPGLVDGGFGEPTFQATGPLEDRGGDVEALDLDGDGLDDVVVATSEGLQAFHQVDGALVRADGDASPFPPSNKPMLLSAADVTGDGSVDLVSTGYDGTWLHVRGEQGWERSLITSARYRVLAAVDLDGDGSAEVVGLTTTSSRRVHVHRLADGAWTDHPTVPSAVAAEEPRTVAVADMDGDGRPDLVVTVGLSTATTNVRTLLQQPDGSFLGATPRQISPGPHGIAIADVDGDGVLDVIVVHDSARISLVRGDGTGEFHSPRLSTVAQQFGHVGSNAMAARDVDRDGVLDVITAGRTGLSWFAGGVEPLEGAADVWIRNLTPAPHSTTASRSATIRIDLDRDLDPASITSSTVRLRDGRTGSALAATRTYDAATRRITLKPDAQLTAGATYRVDVGRLRDLDGAVHEDLVWLPFTVARDTSAPGPVTGLVANGRVGSVELSWTNPTAADLDRIEVWTGYGVFPTSTKNGVLFHRGRGTTKVSIPVEELLTGHLAVYAYDRSGNRSSRVTVLVRWPSLAAGVDATTVTRGNSVTITGALADRVSNKPLSGQKVELLQRPAGQTSWSRVTTATVDSRGNVSFSRKPSVTTAYRLRYPGSAGYLGEVSGAGTVKVRSAVTAKLSATSVKKGAVARLTGTVAPVRSGATLDIERRRSDGTWTRIGTSKVRSDGTYRFDVPTTSTGTHRYRVRMPATDTNAPGTSPTVTLKVT